MVVLDTFARRYPDKLAIENMIGEFSIFVDPDDNHPCWPFLFFTALLSYGNAEISAAFLAMGLEKTIENMLHYDFPLPPGSPPLWIPQKFMMRLGAYMALESVCGHCGVVSSSKDELAAQLQGSELCNEYLSYLACTNTDPTVLSIHSLDPPPYDVEHSSLFWQRRRWPWEVQACPPLYQEQDPNVTLCTRISPYTLLTPPSGDCTPQKLRREHAQGRT